MLSLEKAVQGAQEAQKDLPEIRSRLQNLEEGQRTTSDWVRRVEQKTDTTLPKLRWEEFLRDELPVVKHSILEAQETAKEAPPKTTFTERLAKFANSPRPAPTRSGCRHAQPFRPETESG